MRKKPSGVSAESSSIMINQQIVSAIRQSICQVRFHNPVIRKHCRVSGERGLGCANLAVDSLALADDCSAKDDCFLHDATSCDLTAAEVKTVPGGLIDKTHSNCVAPAAHSAPVCFHEYLQCWQRVC